MAVARILLINKVHMEDKQFEVLANKVNAVDTKVSEMDRDMATDRHKMDNHTIAIEEVKKDQELIRDQQKQILERLTKMDTKMKEAVRDAVNEAVGPLKDLLAEFNQKKILTRTINIHPLIMWWRKIRG